MRGKLEEPVLWPPGVGTEIWDLSIDQNALVDEVKKHFPVSWMVADMPATYKYSKRIAKLEVN